MTPVLAEFIGTAVMLLLGTGVCANVSLARTKGNGAGWIVVIVTWAMAVFTGVVIAGPYSGAHLNPSVTLAFAATGQFPWSDVPGYVLAQMLGGAAGALATWLFYRPHFDLEENPDTIRGGFCTAPAVRSRGPRRGCRSGVSKKQTPLFAAKKRLPQETPQKSGTATGGSASNNSFYHKGTPPK